jgi:serine-type D-Ala-D-Ala carboxypeptidase/endopeptidase (penicillin-binding protein 4)
MKMLKFIHHGLCSCCVAGKLYTVNLLTSFLLFLSSFLLHSCTTGQKLSKKLTREFTADPVFEQAHTGVAVYNASTGKYLYQYNSRKYFVPASNIKIPTLYAGMKYLGDSLPGLQYAERNDTVFITPTGDPSFLHPDYRHHPVFDFLKAQHKTMVIQNNNWKTEALGYGWAWDDYMGSYMIERSPMPVYGNYIKWIQQRNPEERDGVKDTATIIFTDPEINWDVKFSDNKRGSFDVTRPRTENRYTITEGKEVKCELEVPFVTNGLQAALELLKDTLHANIAAGNFQISNLKSQIISSQPGDSLFKPLMHRSDNFFAEQTLLMVSNQLLGYMDEQKLIDTLLKTDLKEFPQKPKWVDGSGLSRYNLFTPEDFVWLLGKMKDEFGLERLKTILATGNEGTLRTYYKEEAGFIFAKTGTLSNHAALSGFLITPNNQLLIFSVLVNNHIAPTSAVRRAVEKFLKQVRLAN